MQLVSPMNLTMSNNYITLYTFGSEYTPTIAVMFFTNFCNLQDEITQTFSFLYNTMERDNLQTSDITTMGI